MKRLFALLVIAVFVLLGVVVVRTMMISAPAAVTSAPVTSDVDAQAVAQHLAENLRFQTVSYGSGIRDAEKNAQLEAMRQWFETTYPNLHLVATREIVGESLLFTWKGKDARALPILLLAHMDVVPVVPGTEGDWTHAPFAGDIADGYVWGRGAIDDKGSLVCLLEAAEHLAAAGFVPARTVMFALGQDEEVGGSAGNAVVARTLQERGVRFAWALDEAGAIVKDPMAGIKGTIAFLSVAEKGYLTLQLVAHGEGGHSSRPSKDLAIARLSAAVTRVLDHPFASGLDDIERRKLAALAPLAAFPQRMALANLWLTSPFVVRQMSDSPDLAARLHTTISPTILSAGVKDNVLPPTATAVVNFRLHPRDSIASVTAHVKDAINDPKVDVTALRETLSEASNVANLDGLAYAYVSSTIQHTFGGIPVAPDITTGATDSRHYLPIAGDVFRLFPFALDLSDLPRVHGTNERLAVASLGPAVQFYRRLLEDLGP